MNHKTKFAVLFAAVAALVFAFPSMLNAQAERLSTKASASVTVGHNDRVNEHVRLVSNEVTTVARHCQKYMREVSGIKIIDNDACNADTSTVYYRETSLNLRTNAGADAQSSQMGNTATQAASCNFVALTNDAGAPAAGDTTLASEITTNGLGRAQGTYAHTTGTTVFTITKTFNATGTQASQKAGLFNASSSGTMCFENTYSAVTVNNGDTLTVTWTINI
jgi:hypothetical protein